MKEIGIYIHIPFCSKKCNYCDFISFDNKSQAIEMYMESLKKEILLEGEKHSSNYIIKTIYFGGGTPSFIDSKYIEEIINIIKEKWEIEKDAEITIEVNPGTVNKEKLQAYYNSGINRLSIGLQSSQNEELKLIGRIHTYEEFLATYELAKKIGFNNVNVDIIIGLPNQTIHKLEETINRVIKLKPKHISVYSLILEEGTKLFDFVGNGVLSIPDENIERAMYWNTKERLKEAGYIHYEISNYAIEGHESKHNLECWEQEEYIGFGVAAHSYLNDKRYSNPKELSKYIDAIENNKDIKEIHEIQNKESKMKEYVLLGLRKIEGVKISDFKRKFIDNPVYVYKEELNKLVGQGLIEVDVDNIKLTNKGIDLANQVWKEFV